MKVYFEITGGGCGKNAITVYVEPENEQYSCHAHYFALDGTKHQFAWATPSRAKVFDSSELPKKLWYSIQHGVWHIDVDMAKGNDWTLEDLEYKPVSKASVDALLEVKKRINDVQTLDDFKALYPLIKKSKAISDVVMNKLFSLCGLQEYDVNRAKNGEIGIAFFQKSCYYRRLLVKIGLEKK